MTSVVWSFFCRFSCDILSLISELLCCSIPAKDTYEPFLFILILSMNGDIHGEFKSMVIQWVLELRKWCFFSDSVCKLFRFLLCHILCMPLFSLAFLSFFVTKHHIYYPPLTKSCLGILTGWGRWFGNGCKLVCKIILLWQSHISVFTWRNSVDASQNWRT